MRAKSVNFLGCLSQKGFGEACFNPQHNKTFGKETRNTRNIVSARKMQQNAIYIKQLSWSRDERN